jgi:hypothetical protein
MANAEPRGSAPMVVDSSLAYRRTTSGSRFKSTLTVFKEIERENRPEYAKQRMLWEGKEVAYNQMKKDYLEACKQPLPGNDVVNRPPEDIIRV